MFRTKSLLLLAALLLAAPVRAADFAMPADGPIAFRRDRVPLDPDEMSSISRILSDQADELRSKTPADRRGAAQTLALALALDPGNAGARRMLGRFADGTHRPTHNKRAADDRQTIWRDVEWLETPEAGADGIALAACLKDVLALANPSDPRSEAHLESGKPGAWKTWIPPLEAYQPLPEPDAAPEPEDVPDQPAVLLAKASLRVPMLTVSGKDAEERWDFAPRDLEMTASEAESGESKKRRDFEIRFAGDGERSVFRKKLPGMIAALKARHGELPTGVIVDFGGEALLVLRESKLLSFPTAAAAVLASAALSGSAPDAVIIGDLDAAGTLVLPADFWGQLRALGKGSGGRLILPAAAADSLASVLALERPEFFFQNHVLLAADFGQLLDLAAKKPGEALTADLAKFGEIREKRGSESVGPYVANAFVRRRLDEIARETPYDFSARMLAIQGAGHRPNYVTRPVLITELRAAIGPVKWLPKVETGQLGQDEIARLGPTYEDARSQVDALARYTDTPERPIVQRTIEMLATIRVLDRAARARGDYASVTATIAAQSDFKRAYKTLEAQFAAALGEPPPP